MELDQLIFKSIYDLVSRLRKKKPDPAHEQATVYLEDIRPRLQMLASLLCGTAIRIHDSADAGGYSGSRFFLPRSYNHSASLDANLEYYLFRTLYLSIQRELGFNWETGEVRSLQESLDAARSHADKVMLELQCQYPAFYPTALRVIETENHWLIQKGVSADKTGWLFGKWMEDSPSESGQGGFSDPVKKQTVVEAEDTPEISEQQGPAKEQVKVLNVNTQEQEQYTMTHNFEKIETIEEFNGNWRDFDGSNDMKEHAKAMEELNLDQLVRVDSPVHSIYRTDFINSLGLAESKDSNGKGYLKTYDEWNYVTRSYRKHYCKIYAHLQLEKNAAYAERVLTRNNATLNKLRRHFARFFNEYHQLRRQATGKDPDLDAVVERYVDLHTGKTPSEFVYLDKRKQTRDIAILILTDVSLSTDGFSSGKRILDVEKEALLLFGTVLSDYKALFQIDTFSSQTRNHCNYTTVKAFHESWGPSRARIGAIEPSGYTRIGPAIRHATWLLEKVRAEKKWLILLSDGKPNDFDRYEGTYGIRDVRWAIKEAEQKDITLSALAIDEKAKYYLPQMMGKSIFRILRHTAQLPEALLHCYLQIRFG